MNRHALIAQLVEHVLGKNGVMGSNPIEGSTCRKDKLEHNVFVRRRIYGEAEV